MQLGERIKIAEVSKPKFGQPCNHCGWCCMTEVCEVGKRSGAGEMIPCKFLYASNGDHFCDLAKSKAMKKTIGIGTGCDAITQNELLEQLQQGGTWLKDSNVNGGKRQGGVE
jgi:uncharacterized cysteine cluster protein YcgN (CxxCxxCC family)